MIAFAACMGSHAVVAELNVFHHTKGGYGDEAAFAAADMAFREKWMPVGVRAA